jgi:NTP pyrophosphatase (non-canonical NTP hydrolase)
VTPLERGRALIREFDLGTDPAPRALDLSSETGELCKEVLKGTDYGTRAFEPTPDLEMELGDAYFSLLALASSLNLDLDAVLELALAKLRDRIARDGRLGSGLKFDL